MDERADIAKLSVSLREDMKAKGITFIDPDRAAFRAALKKTSFYADWKAKFAAGRCLKNTLGNWCNHERT